MQPEDRGKSQCCTCNPLGAPADRNRWTLGKIKLFPMSLDVQREMLRSSFAVRNEAIPCLRKAQDCRASITKSCQERKMGEGRDDKRAPRAYCNNTCSTCDCQRQGHLCGDRVRSVSPPNKQPFFSQTRLTSSIAHGKTPSRCLALGKK